MAYDSVRDWPDFVASERIWWLYLREAVEHLSTRHKHPELQEAYTRVKEFPEWLPDERQRWLDLRKAVRRVLEQDPRG